MTLYVNIYAYIIPRQNNFMNIISYASYKSMIFNDIMYIMIITINPPTFSFFLSTFHFQGQQLVEHFVQQMLYLFVIQTIISFVVRPKIGPEIFIALWPQKDLSVAADRSLCGRRQIYLWPKRETSLCMGGSRGAEPPPREKHLFKPLIKFNKTSKTSKSY